MGAVTRLYFRKRSVGVVLLALAPPLMLSGPFRSRNTPLNVNAHNPSAQNVQRIQRSSVQSAIAVHAENSLAESGTPQTPSTANTVATASSTTPAVAPTPPPLAAHTRGLCTMLARNDGEGHFLSMHDVNHSAVDGNSLQAVVSRGAASALAPDWAPDDLFNVRTMQPASAEQCEPPDGQCLRREAAVALNSMLGAMREAHVTGQVHSAFRRYLTQCAVFRRWSETDPDGMCGASKQSALAGHSQHQLGTTLDLFTREWTSTGPVFRPGFGCSNGGQWLSTHAREYGFVLSYPLHPDARENHSECSTKSNWHTIDPRTGYEYEPWHLRYIGPSLVQSFEQAQQQWHAQTGEELTLDQWLRHQAGRPDDGDLPVCDGCSCGACSTLSVGENNTSDNAGDREHSACERSQMLAIRSDGLPVFSQEIPSIESARVVGNVVEVTLHVPEGTVTQTPVPREELMTFQEAHHDGQWRYREGAQPRTYRPLPSAWRLGFAAESAQQQRHLQNAPAEAHSPWLWQRGLSFGRAPAQYNGATLYLPARAGTIRLRTELPVHPEQVTLRVALLRDDAVFSPQTVQRTEH